MNPGAHWVQYPKEGSCRSIPPPPAHALNVRKVHSPCGGRALALPRWVLSGPSLAPPLFHLRSKADP